MASAASIAPTINLCFQPVPSALFAYCVSPVDYEWSSRKGIPFTRAGSVSADMLPQHGYLLIHQRVNSGADAGKAFC